MKKAIFRKFIIVITLALFLSGSIFAVTISNVMLDQTREDMLYILTMFDLNLDYSKELKPQVESIKNITTNRNTRFTILDLEGNVHADSSVDASTMENHIDRKEVKEAILKGIGDARRFSNTLHQNMLYVATLSQEGNYILRVAVPFSGIYDYLGLLFPVVFVSIGITLIVSLILARQFSYSVTKPLNNISEEMQKLSEESHEFHFQPCPYDEINLIADTTSKMTQAMKASISQIEFEKVIRQEFFSNVSHELKTPITSIRGYMELLESGMFNDENQKKDFLSRIKKEISNMTNLINDILMISQLETKEVEVTLTDIRLCPLVEEVCSSLAPLAAEYQVSIHINCKPLIIYANSQQMKELFNNLITNAIKYNKPGGFVNVIVTSELEEIVIIVEDTGVGIPEESKARVFERFYRVDKGRSKKVGGTGLGLSIVKHVVNYYNGTIEVESKLMSGTKFIVRLPMKSK